MVGTGRKASGLAVPTKLAYRLVAIKGRHPCLYTDTWHYVKMRRGILGRSQLFLGFIAEP